MEVGRSFSRKVEEEVGTFSVGIFYHQGVRSCKGVFVPASVMSSKEKGKRKVSEVLRIAVLVLSTRTEFSSEI